MFLNHGTEYGAVVPGGREGSGLGLAAGMAARGCVEDVCEGVACEVCWEADVVVGGKVGAGGECGGGRMQPSEVETRRRLWRSCRRVSVMVLTL